MDRFKEYINKHKDYFQDNFREEKVWENICKKLWENKKVVSFKKRTFQVAAIVAFLLSLGTYLFLGTGKLKDQDFVLENQQSKDKTSHTLIAIDSSKITAVVMPYVAKPSRRGENKRSENRSKSHRTRNSYHNELMNQLQKIRTTPVYAESPNYFDLFVNQYKQLTAYEQVLHKEFGANQWEDSKVFLTLYRQKYSLLSQLRLEIEKMNVQIIRNSRIVNRAPYFINI